MRPHRSSGRGKRRELAIRFPFWSRANRNLIADTRLSSGKKNAEAIDLRADEIRESFLAVGLLFGKVADDGQLELLALVGLDEAPDRRYQGGESHKRNEHPSDDGDDAQDDLRGERGQSEKQALEGVKADKRPLVIRFHHQEDDRRDDGDVGQHAGSIVGHAARSGRGSRSCTHKTSSREIFNWRRKWPRGPGISMARLPTAPSARSGPMRRTLSKSLSQGKRKNGLARMGGHAPPLTERF